MSYLVRNYNRKKISFKSGKGSYLFSTNGSKYLDFCSGIAVTSLGHANPKLIKALNFQARKIFTDAERKQVRLLHKIEERVKIYKGLTNPTKI